MKQPATDGPPSPTSAAQDVETLRTRLSQSQCNIGLCRRLASALDERGERADAVQVASTVAEACLAQGRLPSAIEAMELMLELAPERVELHQEIGRTHLELGYFKKAATSFARAFDGFTAQKNPSRAQESLGYLGRVQKSGVTYRVREASWLIACAQSPQALASLKACVEIFEEDQGSQDFSTVGSTIRELAASDPAAAEELGAFLAQRADSLIERARFDAAVKMLCWAIKAAPTKPQTYRRLAELLTAKGYGQQVLEAIGFVGRKLGGGDAVKDLIKLSEELSERSAKRPTRAAKASPRPPSAGSGGWPFRLIVEEFEELGQEEDWPFIEPEAPGLGGEETSPSAVSRASARASTPSIPSGSTRAISFGGICVGQNLLELLGQVNLIEELSCLRFFVAGEPAPRAEIMVQAGEVLMGARVQGVSLAALEERGLIDAGGVDIGDMLQRWDTRPIGDPGATDRQGEVARVPSPQEARLYSIATAHYLARLAEMGRDLDLEMRVQILGGDTHELKFPTAELLLETAAILCAGKAAVERLVEQDFGEERWVLGRTPGSDCYLPMGSRAAPLSFNQLRQLTAFAGELAAQTQPLNQGSDRIGISFLSKQSAWGAVMDAQAILLARCENQDIGRMVSKMRALTGE